MTKRNAVSGLGLLPEVQKKMVFFNDALSLIQEVTLLGCKVIVKIQYFEIITVF